MFQKILRNKGLTQFIIRLAIFFAMLFGFYLFVFLYFRHTPLFLDFLQLGDEFYFPFLTGLRKSDFINSALFAAVLFVIWNRGTITKLQAYKQEKRQTALLVLLAVFTQAAHYAYKFWINTHMETALQFSFLLTLLKYLINAVFVVFLLLAVFNLNFFKEQFSKFRRQLPYFALLIPVYYFIIQGFQMIWRIFGEFVAKALYFLLNLSFDNVYINAKALTAPSLGVGNFRVGISEECSGIDSILLFLSLYAILFVLDWSRLNRKRMLILLIPGIMGTIAYNILRVYLLMLVGVFISPEFAVDVFHTNIGWVLFLVFFIIFWHYGSRWVYKKSQKKA